MAAATPLGMGAQAVDRLARQSLHVTGQPVCAAAWQQVPSTYLVCAQDRGTPADRDRAYHQGTVWPWLIGPYADAVRRSGEDPSGVLNGLELHLGEFGLGSVSETLDGDAPHAATGCPFQAWSVAELIRARSAVDPVPLAT